MSPQVVAYCAQCSEVVRPGEGYLEVDAGLAGHRQSELSKMLPARALIDYRTLAEACAMYPEVPWRIWHRKCDPEPDSGEYWFDVGSCTTIAQLLDWNCHLHEKTWISHTTWDEMLARSVAEDGTVRLRGQR